MTIKAGYIDVMNWIRENIENGTLRYGERLLSEKELAQQFGVSRQTVRHATGELVKEHILTRVQGSGTYIGSASPATQREQYHNIAVISTFYESYIFPPTLRGIERILQESGYTMQVAFTDNQVDREETILRGLLDKDNIDGLIVEPSKSALPNPNLHYYQEILERHIPIITFNAYYPDLHVPCVRIDDRAIARKAAQVLLDAGHTRIGALLKLDDGQGRLRYEGYMQALLDAGIQPDPQSICWIDTYALTHMEDCADYLFRRLKDCTALLCYNDEAAMKVIDLAVRRGIHIPEDLSIIGIDDSNLASICRVPFASFPHPKETLGSKVAENLLAMIRDPAYDANHLYDADVIMRESIRTLVN